MEDSHHDHESTFDNIDVTQITGNKRKAQILNRLKNNDPNFTYLYINGRHNSRHSYNLSVNDYALLGYFIGKNEHLKEISFAGGRLGRHQQIELFFRGFNKNQSIERVIFNGMDLTTDGGGDILRMMKLFFKSNHALTDFTMFDCRVGHQGAAMLSLAKSLKRIVLSNNEMDDETLAEVSRAVGTLPRLERLKMIGNNVGRGNCTEIVASGLLGMNELHCLDLSRNNIDDRGVEALAHALYGKGMLRRLCLGRNPGITIRGYWSLSTLLKSKDCKIEELDLDINTNKKWSIFSNILCDTSSVNKTYLSNHTLNFFHRRTPRDVAANLNLNGGLDKKQVAVIKILLNHESFNMHPLFEWDFKVLPSIIGWFERAQMYAKEWDLLPPDKAGIRNKKLSSIFQFVQGMPMDYIGSCLAEG